ncbi:hypothetical protein CN242_29195, partial [Sinorhizobium meliloti]
MLRTLQCRLGCNGLRGRLRLCLDGMSQRLMARNNVGSEEPQHPNSHDKRLFGQCPGIRSCNGCLPVGSDRDNLPAGRALVDEENGTVRNSVRWAMMMKRRESSHGYRERTSGPAPG